MTQEGAVIENWVDECRNGSVRAYARVVEAMQDRIIGFLYRMTLDRALAEELAQEAFLRGYQRIASYDRKKASFSTWLHQIARNLCIDAMRKRRGVHVQFDGDYDEPASPEPCPRGSAADGELEGLIAAAVESLEPAYREVFILREYQDVPVDDIAGIVGCPPGTVKSRLYRARSILQDKLAPALNAAL